MHKNFLKEYNKYKDKIYNHFYYRVSFNVDIAEDLTSDTFLKAYASYRDYDNRYSFATWIYTIAGNILTDYYRKSGRSVVLDDEHEYTDNYQNIEENELKLDIEFDFKIVKKEIDKLTESQKECMILKFIDEMSYDDIARITGKKQNAIRKIISRAIKKIKINLDRYKKNYYE